MKYLTDRTEIAMAMNFGKYPVLYIDVETPIEGYSGLYRGCDMRLAWDDPRARYKDMCCEGHLLLCDGKLEMSNNAGCLKASFGREDVIEMQHWANTPIVHKGQTVIVVKDRPKQRVCHVEVMKVSDYIDIHCQTCCRFVEVPEDFEI